MFSYRDDNYSGLIVSYHDDYILLSGKQLVVLLPNEPFVKMQFQVNSQEPTYSVRPFCPYPSDILWVNGHWNPYHQRRTRCILTIIGSLLKRKVEALETRKRQSLVLYFALALGCNGTILDSLCLNAGRQVWSIQEWKRWSSWLGCFCFACRALDPIWWLCDKVDVLASQGHYFSATYFTFCCLRQKPWRL
jgi:hypothetical protein